MKIRILKNIGKSSFIQTLLGRLLCFYVLLVYKTSRWTVEGLRDEYVNGDFSFLSAFWHGRCITDIFLVEYARVKKKISVLISLHRDGRIMASAMSPIGVETIDGSSKRGGAAAALEIIKTLKRPGNMIAIAPDGHEPGYKMTDGVIVMAKKSQRPIVLSAFSAKRGFLLKTWDSFLMPFPFNKGVLLLSEPIYVPADLDKNGIEEWRQMLEKRLIELTKEADRRAGTERGFLNARNRKKRNKAISLYRKATYLFYPLIAAYLAVRKARGKEDLTRFGERMGYASKPRPEGKLVWLHGASVGETLSALPLIKKIQELYPSVHILVTSGTVTSAQLMEKRLSGTAFHQYVPIDCMPQVTRFIDHWKPDLALWLESEFWPNILSVVSDRNVPLMLINGRVSDKSLERWKKLPRLSWELQGLFVKSFGQTPEDAQRLLTIGARNPDCVGNIKFAADPLPVDEDELKRMKKQIGFRTCWTAGSTHAGEDEIVASVHKEIKEKIPDILTIVAPRHPNRADEVEAVFKKAGLIVARRSRKEGITKETDVYLADTIGEMGLFYRLGDVAFVGGSMIPFGGQNVIEPARLGKAAVCGQYMMNFREVVARAKEADALCVVETERELSGFLTDVLTDKKLLSKKQKNALAFAEAESNVLDRLMPELDVYLTDRK